MLIPAQLLYGANPCRDCHEKQVAAIAAGPHAAVAARDARFCATCHGDPKAHLESGDPADIVGGKTLATWRGERQALACASCHEKEFPAWRQAPHTANRLCWSCHASQALHSKGEPPLGPAKAHQTWGLCISCHPGEAAQFRMVYRHPVERGVMDCTDCHDIHGRSVLQTNRVDDHACLRCHEEQKGPFLFEHAGMEQGCSNCHAAHGSPHRGQLLSSGNGACLTCHIQSNFPGIGKTSHDSLLSGGGRCWDCHSEVHGSNTTPDFNPRGRRLRR
ncbi:MAG TPA: cytochrome c3 family protein [Thermoanaerobaculia bacterium]